ncbi:MAG TPA: serine hydrolase domain-containing protein, partial [Polyangiaceae bacterium]|nr:serine hydrolase domain-containing protein [Polyangiaceae bacterium]
LSVCALQACSDDSDTNAAREAAFPQSASAELQHTLDDVVHAGVAPGVSAVVKRPGYAEWAGAAGSANIQTSIALTPGARFRAGSIMKVAVATAVLQLVERGLLSLDDVLTKRLPNELAARIPNADSITVRMLLNHTSGIPEFADDAFHEQVVAAPAHVWSSAEFYDLALAKPPLFAPGTSWAYSNTDYILLGDIMEGVTHEPWRQTVRHDVFTRAHLSTSSLPEPGDASCSGCARGYEPIGDQLVDLTEIDPSMAGAAGGEAFVTTPSDLAKLVSELARGALYDDPHTLELMLSFADAPVPQETQVGYGLGIARFQMGDVELIGHLGGTAGFQSFVFYQPSSGTTVSGYMNRQGDFGAFVLPFMTTVGKTADTPAK